MILVFDLDDTLINASHFYGLAIKKILTEDQTKAYKEARLQTKVMIDSQSTSQHNRLIYFKKMFEILGQFSPDAALDKMHEYEQALQGLIRDDLKHRDLVGFLNGLKKDHELNIITNENLRTQLVKIKGFDPKLALFKHILVSEEYGVPKPGLKMFKELSSRYAGSKPDQFMIVGDSLKNDIQPGQEMGWKTCWSTEFIEATGETVQRHKEIIGSRFRNPDQQVAKLFDIKVPIK